MKAGNLIPASVYRPTETMSDGSYTTSQSLLGKAWVSVRPKRTTEDIGAGQQVNSSFVVIRTRGERRYKPEDVIRLAANRGSDQRDFRVTGVRPMTSDGSVIELDCVEVLA